MKTSVNPGAARRLLKDEASGDEAGGVCVTFAYLLEEGRILHNAYPEHTVNKHIT